MSENSYEKISKVLKIVLVGFDVYLLFSKSKSSVRLS